MAGVLSLVGSSQPDLAGPPLFLSFRRAFALPIAPVLLPLGPPSLTTANFHIILCKLLLPGRRLPLADRGYASFREAALAAIW